MTIQQIPATGLHSWCGLSVACSEDPLCDAHALLRDYDTLSRERDRYRNALQRIAEEPSDVTLTGTRIFARQALKPRPASGSKPRPASEESQT